MDHQQHAEYGLDSSIEFDDDELYRCFTEFFVDVIEEFESFGPISNIFVTRNYEPHLRGNVYVQYEKIRDAAKAYQRMNGRFYASKQIRVEFRSPIVWTAAVCGKLTEMSWDDVDIPAKQRANWRWSETPEVEQPTREIRSTSRTSASSRRKNGSRSRDSSSSSRNRSVSDRRSRSRSRDRSRHRSRERRRREEKRKRHSRSRSRSVEKKKSKIKEKKRSRSRSRESRTSRKNPKKKSAK